MWTKRYILTAIVVVYFAFALCGRGASPSLPERKIDISADIHGIRLFSRDRERDYLPCSSGNAEDNCNHIVLPENEQVCMLLMDDGENTPNVNDIAYICAQNPYVVQELLIRGASEWQAGTIPRILETMVNQKALEEITLKSCRCEDLGSLQNIPSLQELQLIACAIPSEAHPGKDLEKSQIRDLLLFGTWPKQGFGEISHINSLRSLGVRNVDLRLQMHDVVLLNTMPHLVEVGLLDTDITSDSLRYIAQLSSVRSLDLSLNDSLANSDFGVLTNMRHLRTIQIDGLVLSRKALATLQGLKGITLIGSPRVSDE